MTKKLHELSVGEHGVVHSVDQGCSSYPVLLTLGFESGGKVMKYLESPLRKMSAYLVLDSVIALRDSDALSVSVTVGEE